MRGTLLIYGISEFFLFPESSILMRSIKIRADKGIGEISIFQKREYLAILNLIFRLNEFSLIKTLLNKKKGNGNFV